MIPPGLLFGGIKTASGVVEDEVKSKSKSMALIAVAVIAVILISRK